MSFYLREIINQRNFANLAVEDLTLSVTLEYNDVRRSFASVQLLLSSAALISKLLYPSNMNSQNGETTELSEFSKMRAKRLRKKLRVRGNFPLLERRSVRNKFEHWDEQMDNAVLSNRNALTDLSVYDGTVHDANGKQVHHLRKIMPEARTIVFADDTVNIDALMAEIEEISSRASAVLVEMGYDDRGSFDPGRTGPNVENTRPNLESLHRSATVTFTARAIPLADQE